ncbi:MAG: hypothetical protein RL208_656 [Pseudomonadota bacterium]|jgi:predicted glycoside hydrolase/deacetylase ChbG (UPF0249 family)
MNNNKSLIRVNADDFGISPGVNSAVIDMFQAGKLHSASIMTGGRFFAQAVDFYQKNNGLKVGLHFCLTIGKCSSEALKLGLLVDENGVFKHGFLKLLILSIFKKKELQKQVEIELRAQLDLLKKNNILIHHIDGHRHVHIIPAIWSVVLRVASEYGVKKIRHINESAIDSVCLTGDFNVFKNGGIVKWGVLRFLNFFNKSYQNSERFFSILYTCRVDEKMFLKLQKSVKQNFEIMIHPSDFEVDKNFLSEIEYEQDHLKSGDRFVEYWR